MSPSKPILLPLILLSICALRCAREVYVQLPEEEPRVVLVGSFEPDSVFKAQLTLSQPVFTDDSPARPITTDVLVTSNERYFDRLKMEVINGDTIWVGRKKAAVATPYNLTVRADGFPVASASSIAPLPISLEPIQVHKSDYEIVALNDKLSGLRIPLALTIAASAVPENPYFAFNIRHETAVYERQPNGQKIFDYDYQENSGFVTDGRTFALLNKIPEPVTLIHANFWRDQRKTLLLDVVIPFKPDTEWPRRIFVEWRTLSPEYYHYYLSLSRQGANLPLSDPDALYNNVENGYGNFSGFSRSVQSIELPE